MDEILVQEQELRKKMAELINEANLPGVIVEPILKDVLAEVVEVKRQQYVQALKNIENKKKKEDK